MFGFHQEAYGASTRSCLKIMHNAQISAFFPPTALPAGVTSTPTRVSMNSDPPHRRQVSMWRGAAATTRRLTFSAGVGSGVTAGGTSLRAMPHVMAARLRAVVIRSRASSRPSAAPRPPFQIGQD